MVSRTVYPSLRGQGHVLLAVLLAAGFLIARLPLTDMQAAEARSTAARQGVGLGYWFSWFGGTSPGSYSVLTPALTAVLGVGLTAALSVVAVALLVGPLVRHSPRPVAAAYAAVLADAACLWSGRVAFCVGAAFAVGAVLAVHRGRPWLGGAANLVAALASPLTAAFTVLAHAGVLFGRREGYRPLMPLFVLSGVGLLAPAILFGGAGTMTFTGSDLAWFLVLTAAPLILKLPRTVILGLPVALVAGLVLYLVPTGVGATVIRFGAFVLPPVVVALSRSPRRILALAVAPAVLYTSLGLISDVSAASAPSASAAYYAALKKELLAQPGRLDHRVEALDTPTHRTSRELGADLYLARGWESQIDAQENPIFYGEQPLTAQAYLDRLSALAVAWVAVPDDPNLHSRAEAVLVNGGLPYLHRIWSDAHWVLYAVSNPTTLVDAPARVISAQPGALTLQAPGPMTMVVRTHYSRYLTVSPGSLPVHPDGSAAIRFTVPSAGQYVLSG